MEDRTAHRVACWFARVYPQSLKVQHGDEFVETLAHGIAHVRRQHPLIWLPLATINVLGDLLRESITGRQAAQRRTLADVRLAIRRWRARPALALTAIATLALGIGSSTAIYSAVDGVLLKPLPWRDSDRLITIYVARPKWRADPSLARAWDTGNLTWASFLQLRNERDAFEDVAAWQRLPLFLGGPEPELIQTMRVSSSFLPTLGVTPYLGRFFSAEEDDLITDSVVMTYETWLRRYGGAPDIVGHRLSLQSVTRTVIGILPPGFVYLEVPRAEFLVPMGTLASAEKLRPENYLANTVARLRPNVTLEQARQLATLVIGNGDPKAEREGRVVSMLEAQVGIARWPLLLLLGAAGLLLLIASSSVAGLLLGEASDRRHEIAVRAALGGSRRQVARQLWTESFVLAGLGVASGLLLAVLLLPALVSLAPPGTPRIGSATLDVRECLFAIAAGALTSVIFGTGPALALSRTGATHVLRDGGRGATAGTRRTHRLVVAVQVALTVVLLVGAGLLGETVRRLTSVPVGFDPSPLAVVRVSWPEVAGQTETQQQARLDDVLSRIKAVPGVQAAAGTMAAPFSGWFGSNSIQIEGRTFPKDPTANRFIVTEDYFSTIGQQLRRGRLFAAGDRAGEPVAIVTTQFEKDLMDGDAVGGRFTFNRRRYRIIGVVDGARQRDYTDILAPAFYLLSAHAGSGVGMFVVRTGGDAAPFIADIRQAITSAAPGTAIQEAAPMPDLLKRTTADERYRASISTAFGISALILAAIGLYGIVSRSVAERRQEIGIRVALGARQGNVLWLVFQQGLVLVGTGLLAGVPMASLSARLISSQLFGVTSSSGYIFGIVSAALVATAVIAMLLPALRACREDPLLAIRQS